jgi:CRP/FNR family transcriptional regulator, cyclic AMP receptor protein
MSGFGGAWTKPGILLMNPEIQTNPDVPEKPHKVEDEGMHWRDHPFLDDLDPEHLAILASCAMPTRFVTDQIIFREGDMANRFYLILDGRVGVEMHAQDRPPVLVEHLAAGDVLGWSWLFPPYIWNFTARAVEPVRAAFFYGTWLREQCEVKPAFGYELMKRTAAVTIRRLQATRRELVRSAR